MLLNPEQGNKTLLIPLDLHYPSHPPAIRFSKSTQDKISFRPKPLARHHTTQYSSPNVLWDGWRGRDAVAWQRAK